MTTYCPYGWAEVALGWLICPECRAMLSVHFWELRSKVDDSAVASPAADERRTAYVLGLLRDLSAVEALAASGKTTRSICQERGRPYTGRHRREPRLRDPEATGGGHDQSVVARRIAAEALRDRSPAREENDD